MLSLFLVGIGFFSFSQRFFYIEANHHTDRMLENELRKAAQFVTTSPLASEYIINTNFDYLTGQDILKMKMNVKDSVTLETIYESAEDYTFQNINSRIPLILKMTIEAFLNRNITRAILTANADHHAAHMQYQRPRKDKI